jgi:signal transduction histidine kinase
MSTFSHSQITALLNLLPEPARLYNVHGHLVAENSAARLAAWPDDDGNAPVPLQMLDLGEGWFVRRMSLTVPGADNSPLDERLPARPNMQSLLGGITHEIRNPLAAILTAISLLQDESGLGEESQILLGVVRKEARRMNQIMTEFSLYVKPPQPYPELFDLIPLLHNVLDELHDTLLSENIEVREELPSQLNVYADQRQIRQVLCRLIENAIEAMQGQGQSTLLLRLHEDNSPVARVGICIEDSGEGFGEDELQRAFLPFYSTKPQSTGLGLSTAQVAVQAAGGALWLENRAERGARVCFVLPRAPANTASGEG